MGLMSVVMAACLSAGTVVLLLGGAVLKASSDREGDGFAAGASVRDLASVGAAGSCLAYLVVLFVRFFALQTCVCVLARRDPLTRCSVSRGLDTTDAPAQAV